MACKNGQVKTRKFLSDKVNEICYVKNLVNKLEATLKELKKMLENDIFESVDVQKKKAKKKINDKIKTFKIQNRREPLLFKCELCYEHFVRSCELECHIKEHHKAYAEYVCEECDKTFVTKWRLKKHKSIHSGNIKTLCYYSKNNLFCPFEELGCKFKHVVRDKYESDIDSKEAIDYIAMDTMVEATEAFYTSTPKKMTECEECLDTSECVDCIVKHMLGRHVVARAIFDGWPPDRLHLIL